MASTTRVKDLSPTKEFTVWCAPCHVMDRSSSNQSAPQLRSTADICIRSRPPLSDFIAEHVVFLAERTKAKGLRQELGRPFVPILRQGDGVNAPDPMWSRHGSLLPGWTMVCLRVSDQFEGEPIWVLEGKDGFVKTRSWSFVGDALLAQALDPIV